MPVEEGISAPRGGAGNLSELTREHRTVPNAKILVNAGQVHERVTRQLPRGHPEEEADMGGNDLRFKRQEAGTGEAGEGERIGEQKVGPRGPLEREGAAEAAGTGADGEGEHIAEQKVGEAKDRLEREELAEAVGTGAGGEGEKMAEERLEKEEARVRRDDGTLGDNVDEGISDLGGKVEQVGEDLQARRRRRDLGQTEEEEVVNAGRHSAAVKILL
ncbi:hypothetical protein AAVH_26237 [Aphelenchoides avenae]|nr:hypothetical protein AAVH_26237 [Aphelenchus avenae]